MATEKISRQPERTLLQQTNDLAHEYHVRGGERHGNDLGDWYAAENELRERQKAKDRMFPSESAVATQPRLPKAEFKINEKEFTRNWEKKEPTHEEVQLAAYLDWANDGKPEGNDGVNYYYAAQNRLRTLLNAKPEAEKKEPKAKNGAAQPETTSSLIPSPEEAKAAKARVTKTEKERDGLAEMLANGQIIITDKTKEAAPVKEDVKPADAKETAPTAPIAPAAGAEQPANPSADTAPKDNKVEPAAKNEAEKNGTAKPASEIEEMRKQFQEKLDSVIKQANEAIIAARAEVDKLKKELEATKAKNASEAEKKAETVDPKEEERKEFVNKFMNKKEKKSIWAKVKEGAKKTWTKVKDFFNRHPAIRGAAIVAATVGATLAVVAAFQYFGGGFIIPVTSKTIEMIGNTAVFK